MARRKQIGALFLKKVGVWGFKAVKFSGYVKLEPLTLLIGRNGSGKSSFVEALQWLQDSYIDGLSAATDERFRAYSYLLNKRSQSKETRLHLEFASLPSGQPIYYDLTVGPAKAGDRPIVTREIVRVGKTKGQKTVLRSTKGRKGPVFRFVVEASRKGRRVSAERNADRLGIVSLSRGHPALRSLADFIERIVVVRLSPTMMRFESPMQRLGGRILDEEGARLPALLDSLDAKERERVRARVAQVLSGIKNIHVEMTHNRGFVSVTERMRWMGGGKDVSLPSWMLSEGTRRLTALFALLAAKEKPSLLMIEEVENGLDPWTLEFVFQQLREHAQPGTQVILTTHSPFLLDHVRVDEVIHVRRQDGESTYHPIGTYADVGKFEGTVAPGAMYISGYYDEKP